MLIQFLKRSRSILFGRNLLGNAALLPKGQIVRPTVVMGVGGIVNLALDYLLIFRFSPIELLGLYGAGFATVISWLVTLTIMTVLLYREDLLSLKSFRQMKQMHKNLAEVPTVGDPAVAAQILNPIAIAALTRSVAAYGTDPVAAYGIATRAEATSFYFNIVGFSFPGIGLALITTSFFNAVYKPKLSLKLTLVKTLLLTILLAFIGF